MVTIDNDVHNISQPAPSFPKKERPFACPPTLTHFLLFFTFPLFGFFLGLCLVHGILRRLCQCGPLWAGSKVCAAHKLPLCRRHCGCYSRELPSTCLAVCACVICLGLLCAAWLTHAQRHACLVVCVQATVAFT